MSDLMLPSKGQSAASLLQELNADHAPDTANQEGTNVTTLQETNEPGNERTQDAKNERPLKRKGASVSTIPNSVSSLTPEAPGRRPRTKAPAASSEPLPEAATPAKRQPETADRQDRYARALGQVEEDEIAVVTVRVSGRLNEYMDRYVERMNRLQPKRRYRKQDAVAEAFAAFYADHPMPPAPEEDDL